MAVPLTRPTFPSYRQAVFIPLLHIRTAIDFAAAHREDIDAQVAANDAAAERVRQLAEQRARLMAS